MYKIKIIIINEIIKICVISTEPHRQYVQIYFKFQIYITIMCKISIKDTKI